MSAPLTARHVKDIQWLLTEVKLYELSEPVKFEDDDEEDRFASHVVVSVRHYCCDHGGPEAMAFACDDGGEWLPGAEYARVGIAYSSDHADAIRSMGHEATA